MKTARETIIAYALLLVVSCLGGASHLTVAPSVFQSAVNSFGEDAALPAGLVFAANAGRTLLLLPAAVIVCYALSLKFRFMASSSVVSLIGGLIAATYLAYGLLLATPLMIVAPLPKSLPPEVMDALRGPGKMELLSLDAEAGRSPALVRSETFHGYSVLGKISLSDEAQKSRVMDALLTGLRQASGAETLCFSPRHGLRLRDNGRDHDLVICFECEVIEVRTGERVTQVSTSTNAAGDFNAMFTAAGIPVSK